MDKDTKHVFVDRTSQKIMHALEQSPIFKKQGTVIARPGVVGEEITTVLKSGEKETKNTVKEEGQWVITNPDGEQYIIGEEKFFTRYEPTDMPGAFSAKGYCRAVVNPFGIPVKIMASWGEEQFGNEKCLFADTCDPNGTMSGEPYIIEAEAFAKTYKKV